MSHTVAGNKILFVPLKHKTIFPLAKDIFNLFLDEIKTHKGDVIIKIGSDDRSVFTLILSDEFKLTQMKCERYNSKENNMGFNSEGSFIIQY